MTETKPADINEAQFKGIGFHQTLASWVDSMVLEFARYHDDSTGYVKCMFTVYKMLLPMLPYISTDTEEDTVEKFRKRWSQIDEKYGAVSFEEKGETRSSKETIARFDAIMALLADSGLIRLSTREENWEDAFVEYLEEKMVKEE